MYGLTRILMNKNVSNNDVNINLLTSVVVVLLVVSGCAFWHQDGA